MSKLVTVPALQEFAYQGRSYRRRDLVVMSPLDAAIHARQGHVSLVQSYSTRQLVAEPTDPQPTQRRRRGRPRKRQVSEVEE